MMEALDIQDDPVAESAEWRQVSYWIRMIKGSFDGSFYNSVSSIGSRLESIGLEPKRYAGKYAIIPEEIFVAPVKDAAGKGLAVPAIEMRTLAQRSVEAVRIIKSLIGTSEELVQSGVGLVERTSDVLMRMIAALHDVNQQVSAIADNGKAQANSIGKDNAAMGYRGQLTQQNAAMAEDTSAAGVPLAREADTLSDLVGRFRL